MDNHVLVPLDGSSLAECVLPHTLAIAEALKARVTLLTVLARTNDPYQVGSIDLFDWALAKKIAASYLEEISQRLRQSNVETDTDLWEGQAAEGIISYTRTHAVNFIALSSHGSSGLSGWNISSVVQKVVLRANISILIVPAYHFTNLEPTGLRYERILVPLDGSLRAEYVLPIALRLAAFHHAMLLIAHVVAKPELPSRLPPTTSEMEMVDQLVACKQLKAENYLAQLVSEFSFTSLDIQTRLIVGENPIRALHDLVEKEDVDLVILSAHGYTGDSSWPFGKVTLSFIEYGNTPILILQDLAPDRIAPTKAENAVQERFPSRHKILLGHDA